MLQLLCHYREGLQKLKVVYSQNPSLGDPNTISGQLKDSCQTIEKLKAEIEKYSAMLDEVDGASSAGSGSAGGSTSGSNTPTASAIGRHLGAQANGGGGASPRSSLASHRTSLSDESLSRSASDSSVCTTNPNTTTTTTSITSASTIITTTTTTVPISHLTKDHNTPSQIPGADKTLNNQMLPLTKGLVVFLLFRCFGVFFFCPFVVRLFY